MDVSGWWNKIWQWQCSAGLSYGASFTANDVVGVALDLDAGTITFYKNNVSQGVAFSTGLTGKELTPWFGGYNAGRGWYANFGQRPFAYTPPTGFKALCTANLPAVAIPNPRQHFDVKTRIGTGAAFSVTGIGFPPDFVWSKMRSVAYDHLLFDSIRGTTKYLISDNTTAEGTDAQSLTAFNADGFSGGTMTTLNENTRAVVDWLWKAGGAGVSNTDGSITSTVSANTTAGFSIVTATSQPSGTATFGHGLGVAPKMIIVKIRGTAGTNWQVYTYQMGPNGYLLLNTTGAVTTDSTYWNNTAPTSTVFTLGSAFAGSYTFVAYCFAEIPGYSKFGYYTGNGSADGPFVFCGSRPRYVLIKSSTLGSSWYLLDTARETYNEEKMVLYPDSAAAEVSNVYGIDCLSNGFKVRAPTGYGLNNSAATYIFATFAEHPFGGSNVSPSPAR